MIFAITLAEYGILFGILTGVVTIVGGALTAYFNAKKDKPEPPALVMAAGESGVKVLDGVVQILRAENERYRNMVRELNERIDELMDEREQAVKARERRIESLTRQLRVERESNGDTK